MQTITKNQDRKSGSQRTASRLRTFSADLELRKSIGLHQRRRHNLGLPRAPGQRFWLDKFIRIVALYSAHSWGIPVNLKKWSASQDLIVSMIIIFGFSGARADVSGSITGVVRDRGQALVTGAKVQVTNVKTNLTQQTSTGSDGSYHFLALPAGTYKITASASGFQAYNATDITL